MNTEILVFKTRIGKSFVALYLLIFLIILSMSIVTYYSANDSSMFSFMAGISTVALIFMSSTFFLLKIKIEDDFLCVDLFYPIYKVDIRTITTIQMGKTMWFGFHKHGTATKGLIISSQFKNDVYITPQNEQEFLQKLLNINPNINIKKD
ncbi:MULTISPECIES: PH domain-containing protein [unclassified Kaistella]|uniref:PH domain-containing protein n=1 Tax=unclassified Kaistella TaxID=2762626 RepID=UPI0027345C6D|nr:MULTISPECIES: PH domain-containing protein [unclassified Kaistella]MDP2454517.1 PH domain-containing protein [Kaistella sp. SH11-4b]MDP2457255.1 PH domain-containing protein [Kaistella sp. SH40-3]MDP2460015.1 PH domain-containing protein [Kaistella sp. SH19-2b]